MSDLSLLDVSHSFGPLTVVEGVSFAVGKGEFWTLLGPSGSGKSTLLRIIGGYIYPSQGRVLLRGQDVTRVSPRQRDIGMVFQDYALFPHMTVFDNVAYGLRARRLDNREIRDRVGEMLELNRLTGLERRHPRELSGGQQQRVALARALVIRPSVLLMDEAMGALDLKLRETMEVEVRRLQRELGITTIHVTHDQAEAMTMSDSIVVMRSGRIEQIGTPQQLNSRPSNRFVAEFVGSNNVFPVTTTSAVNGAVRGLVAGLSREILLCSGSGTELASGQHFLVVRPEDIMLSADRDDAGFSGRVVATRYIGAARCVVIEANARIVVSAFDRAERYNIGDQAHVSWAPDQAHLVAEVAPS